jgi:hypothetical protein
LKKSASVRVDFAKIKRVLIDPRFLYSSPIEEDTGFVQKTIYIESGHFGVA